MGPQMPRHGLWAVLLAGGDGTRLQSLTTRIEGDARPKQFCRITGEQTLLAQTRRRISPLFDPDRVIAVVTKKHERFYSGELIDSPRIELIEQPENRGTGVAIATSLLMLRGVADEAIVAFFPCDHHYSNEVVFVDVVKAGVLAVQNNFAAIVLLGAAATYPETEYGWIEPMAARGIGLMPSRVRQFWEKPSRAVAQSLQRRGCLWNTFVTIGRVSTFMDLLWQAAPNAMRTLSAAVLESDLDSCYRSIPVIDFSRDVLASQTQRLLVIRDAESGWTDLGNPNRVIDTLTREKMTPAWLESLRAVEARRAS